MLEKGDASSDQPAQRRGETLTVGIIRVEEEGETGIVDGNGRLKARRSKSVCHDSEILVNARRHFYCLSV